MLVNNTLPNPDIRFLSNRKRFLMSNVYVLHFIYQDKIGALGEFVPFFYLDQIKSHLISIYEILNEISYAEN